MLGASWLESMGYWSSWLLPSEKPWYGSDEPGGETGQSCMEEEENKEESDVRGQ